MKNKQWKINYFKGPIPQTNLYVNMINKDSLILFGQILNSESFESKSICFYYTDTWSLTYCEDGIAYLEDHGLDVTFENSNFDQGGS